MNLLERTWYQPKHPLSYVLKPVSVVFRALAAARRFYYKKLKKPRPFEKAIVIVVGNISVGGTGKTPLVMYLVDWLRKQGYKPGVIMRGYAAKSIKSPILLDKDVLVSQVGDEAYMIHHRCQCPVVVAKQRPLALEHLLKHTDCNIVISDDGLQHYALARDIEIAVIDGARRFGNGECLPAGPLRERPERLETVDYVISNGIAASGEHSMKIIPQSIRSVCDNSPQDERMFENKSILAVAALGNPLRFFETLQSMSLNFTRQVYSDHYAFQSADFADVTAEAILMTEKDAVKCQKFADDRFYYLPIEVVLPTEFLTNLLLTLKSRCGDRN